MSYDGVLGGFEESSGEIKNENIDFCAGNIVVDNSANGTSSYIIKGHADKGETGYVESSNYNYKQVNGLIEESPIILSDFKCVEDSSMQKPELGMTPSVELECAKEGWWSSTRPISEIDNSKINKNIPPSTIAWTVNNSEEPNLSLCNVNWEDYVLDTNAFRDSPSSVLDIGTSILVLPSTTETEAELGVQICDGFLNAPSNVLVSTPVSVQMSSMSEVPKVIHTAKLGACSKNVDISQNTLQKLPFVKIPKHCLAKGKVIGRSDKSFTWLSIDNNIISKQLPGLVSNLKSITETTKQQSLLKRIIPTNLNQNDVTLNGKQTDVLFPMHKLKKTHKDSLLKINHPRSLLKSNNISTKHVLTDRPTFPKETGISTSKIEKSCDKPFTAPLAVVAISTNKYNDTTEIIIRTEEGENVFKGKTSNIMKATQTCDEVSSYDNNVSTKSGEGVNQDKIDDETNHLVNSHCDVDELDGRNVVGPSLQVTCPIENCASVTTKENYLKVHVLKHYGIRPFKCDYPSCKWAFYTKFGLKRHQETHFMKKKEFKCSFEGCGKGFSTSSNLKLHRLLHNRPATILCTAKDCTEAFQTRKSYEEHLRSHGIEYAPYICSQEGCGKRYFSACTLNSHIRKHEHSELELKCSYCGKIFPQICRLNEHINAHIGIKPFRCDFQGCTWAFSTSSKLRRHQLKHTKARKHKCKVCNKEFMRLEHLKDHQLKHFVKITYICHNANCNAVFNNKSTMYSHLKKHRSQEEKGDSRTFPCPVDNCYLAFTTDEDMQSHLQTAHGPASGIVVFNSASQEGLLVGMSDLVHCIPTSIDHQVDFCESNSSNNITHTNDEQNTEDNSVKKDNLVPMLPLPEMIIEGSIGSSSVDFQEHKDPPGLHMASDVVLSAGMQDTLLQEELTGPDLYMGVSGGGHEELQVMLLDPPSRLQQSVFEQSTINLRDLE